MSTYIPSFSNVLSSSFSFINSYGCGLATLPVSIAVSEVFTRIARSFKLTTLTYIAEMRSYYQTESFPETSTNNSFFKRKLNLFIDNQFVPFIEELLTKIVLQRLFLTEMPKFIGINENNLILTIGRILSVGVLFGFAHWKEVEETHIKRVSQQIMPMNCPLSKKQELYNQVMEKLAPNIKNERNYQVMHAIGKGLFWSALYEYSNQNFALVWGAHASINFFWDFMLYKH